MNVKELKEKKKQVQKTINLYWKAEEYVSDKKKKGKLISP